MEVLMAIASGVLYTAGIYLMLRRRLVHGVEDAEVMLGVLEVGFRHHPVAAAGRIAAELQVLLEQLLRCAAQPHVRA